MISIMTEWMVWNLALGGGLLTASCLFAAMIKSPVRRLRWLEWTLLAALLAPILATTTFPWKHSLHWLPAKNSTAAVPTHLDSVASESLVPRQNTTPVIHTTDGPVPYISLSPETDSQSAPQVRVSESNVSNYYSESNWAVVILSVQAAVMGMTVLWWGIGWCALRCLWRQGKALEWDQLEVDCGPLQGKVELRSHAQVNTPCAFGWWQWKILIPEEMANPSHRKQLRMACAHEWAHLSTGDLRTWRWTRFAQLTLWMQPAYWWMRSQVRLCQDYLADSEAAASGGYTDFAAFLLSLARTQQTVPGTVLSLKGKKSDLTRRIRILIESKGILEKRCPQRLHVTAALLASGVLITSSWIRLEAEKEIARTRAVVSENQVQAEDRQFLYHGRVTDHETHKSIPGATVTVRWINGNPESKERVLQESVHKCDEEGRFKLEITDAHFDKPLLKIELTVSHPGYVTKGPFGGMMRDLGSAREKSELPFLKNVELWTGRKISGRLLTPEGLPSVDTPIHGQTVIKSESSEMGPFVAENFETRTDHSGRFELTVAQEGIAVVAFIPDDFPITELLVREGTSDLGTVRLKEGAMINVRLRDSDNQSVPDLPIFLHPYNSQPHVIDGFPPVIASKYRELITDSDGLFKLPWGGIGEYLLLIDSDAIGRYPTGNKSYAGIFLHERISIRSDVFEKGIELRAHPTLPIRIVQTDSSNNFARGVPFDISGNYRNENHTNQHFSIHVPGTLDGVSTVEIPKGIFSTIRMQTDASRAFRISVDQESSRFHWGSAPLDLPTQSKSVIRIWHHKLPVILVKVVDDDGKDLSEVEFTALNRDSPHISVTFKPVTDERWQSAGIQPTKGIQIAASKEGYYDATQYVSDLVAEEVREITLVMKKK
jgi:hypothetical protein